MNPNRQILAHIFDPANSAATRAPNDLGIGYAVGFGGQLPPGMFAVVGPWDRIGALSRIKDIPTLLSVLEPNRLALGAAIYSDGFFLLGRGGIADFGAPVRLGAMVFKNPLASGVALPITTDEAFATAQELWVPRATPMLTVYAASPMGRASELWIPARSTFKEATIPSTLDDNSVDLWLPPDAVRLTLHFTDNAAGARIQGAETGDFDLYWAMGEAATVFMYAHNQADDFDGAGRLSADAGHDAETYEIPAGALGVSLVQPSTTAVFWAFWNLM